MCGKAAQRGQSAAATRMGKEDDRNAKGQLNELAFLKMAGAAGLEPATIGFGDRCSTNSNYAPAIYLVSYGAFVSLVTSDTGGLYEC